MDDPSRRALAELYPAPLWFPQAFDASRQWVRMVRFEEADYRRAPFLDQRALREGMAVGLVPFAALAERMPPGARRDAHYIFHISHVGSTLISRMLDAVAGTLVLREPPLLQTLAGMDEAQRSRKLPVISALFSRSYDEGQRTIVKATSVVSEIAPALVNVAGGSGKAVLIGVAPESFIASRLGKSLDQLRQRTSSRLARLARHCPDLDDMPLSLDDAHVAALAWAVESSAIEIAAASIDPERVHFVDFDAFIAAPLAPFVGLLKHFKLDCSKQKISSILNGPVMTKYSKNMAIDFDAADRQARIARMTTRHAGEIAGAMRWLERLAGRCPPVAAALHRHIR